MKRGRVLFSLFLLIFSISFIIAMPDPSATYCEEMGYMQNSTDCIFPDNSSCETWAFYNGECGQQYAHEVSCANAGEQTGVAVKCCEGLRALETSNVYEGKCELAIGGYGICSDCGNGICEPWENRCNCQGDCGTGCIEESESLKTNIGHIECCEGLISIPCDAPDSTGKCQYFCTGASFCTKCGDGECKSPENKCNCPTDCNGELCGNRICEETETTLIKWLNCSSLDKTFCTFVPCDEDCNDEEISIIKDDSMTEENGKLYFSSPAGKIEIIYSDKAVYKIQTKDETDKAISVEFAKGTKPKYIVQAERSGKLLFIIPVTSIITYEIDAQTGTVEKTRKQWWSFLVRYDKTH